MKNFLMFLIILFVAFTCFAQTEPMSVERKNAGCWSSIDYNINSFADSLNFWAKNGRMPDFIFDQNFDHSLIGLTRDCFARQHFISFRKAVFDRVINENILVAITEAQDKRLDEYYRPEELESLQKNHTSVHGTTYPDLPYMKYSTRELAKRRLNELRKVKELLSN